MSMLLQCALSTVALALAWKLEVGWAAGAWASSSSSRAATPPGQRRNPLQTYSRVLTGRPRAGPPLQVPSEYYAFCFLRVGCLRTSANAMRASRRVAAWSIPLLVGAEAAAALPTPTERRDVDAGAVDLGFGCPASACGLEVVPSLGNLEAASKRR